MKKKHLEEANIYNVLLCAAVVFIHASSEAINMYNKDSFPYTVTFLVWKLVSYAVPGFFFLSGFRHFYADRILHYRRYIADRIKRIYLPYLLWVIIYYHYFISRKYFDFDIGALLQYMFYGNLVAHFYYLVTIMQFYLLMPAWHKMIRSIRICYSLAAAMAVTVFCRVYLQGFLQTIFHNPSLHLVYNDRVFTSYLVFWVLGCYVGVYYEQFLSFVEKRKFFLFAVYAIITSLHLSLSYLSTRGLYHYKYAEFIHIQFCFVSTVFLYWFCKRCAIFLESFPHVLKIFRTLNSITFYVYLSHIYIINKVTELLDENGITSVTKRFLMRMICTYVIAITGSLLYTFCKKRMKEIRHAYQDTR